MAWWLILLLVIAVLLVLVAIYDLTQKKKAILRNFPVIGHLRYILEGFGPELRQYIVTGNDEERPFNRDQRRWVYSTAKQENAYFGFGTDANIAANGHVIVKQSAFPLSVDSEDPRHPIPAAKVLGAWRDRPGKFRPESIVNVSAMSYGSLSAAAVEAINRGAKTGGFLHNTGEGGIAKHHDHGGDLIYQIGTGYFGCRNPDGSFSMDRMLETLGRGNVKAIEIKLSQGAKPGLGGVLPGAKVTAEIANTRGVAVGETVISPASHSTFHDVDSMIDFIELVAEASRVPVGIKSAVGQQGFWVDLAARMRQRQEGPDYIHIDGGEGGTGAAPLVFTDHVALPFRTGFARVYKTFVAEDLHQDIVWAGAGRLGFPQEAAVAMSLGVDLVMVAREAMLAVGCIQAQECHTGACPTGVATQSRRLMRGLDPFSKADRLANYMIGLRYDLARLARACGVAHPALFPPDSIEFLDEPGSAVALYERFGYDPSWNRLSDTDVAALSPQGVSPQRS